MTPKNIISTDWNSWLVCLSHWWPREQSDLTITLLCMLHPAAYSIESWQHLISTIMWHGAQFAMSFSQENSWCDTTLLIRSPFFNTYIYCKTIYGLCIWSMVLPVIIKWFCAQQGESVPSRSVHFSTGCHWKWTEYC